MLPPLVKLATSAAPGERKYIAFVGAGVSKDAGLPTAWDLMLKTAGILKAAEVGSESIADLEEWFLASKYSQMSYGELIGGLFSTSTEQQRFIQDTLKADKPGNAHLLLAELAEKGVLRSIITTNFDDLLEQALRQKGIPVQVISTDEDVTNSEPLIHCKAFRIYKPHGTLGVGRLRNTPKDLEELSPIMLDEMVRVMSDHGLMVLGYSGADKGIIQMFGKRTQHIYPTFWVNPSEPKDHIPPLFGKETYNFISCDKGAGVFLEDLLKMYQRLMNIVPASGMSAAVVSVKDVVGQKRADATSTVKSFMSYLLNELKSIAPDFSAASGEHDDLLIESLEKTKTLIVDFTEVAKKIAETDDEESAIALYKAFSKIIEEYNNPTTFSGTWFRYKFDFYKFIGHELFTSFIACLIQEGRWKIINSILSETIFVENSHGNKPDVVLFEYISEYVMLLEMRNKRLGLNRVTVHGDVLKQRHSDGDLGKIMPFNQFMEADYFLFLRGQITKPQNAWGMIEWRAWSTIWLNSPPRFILESVSKKFAEKVLEPLGLKSIEDFRAALKEKAPILGKLFERGLWDHPLHSFDIETIGSK